MTPISNEEHPSQFQSVHPLPSRTQSSSHTHSPQMIHPNTNPVSHLNHLHTNFSNPQPNPSFNYFNTSTNGLSINNHVVAGIPNHFQYSQQITLPQVQNSYNSSPTPYNTTDIPPSTSTNASTNKVVGHSADRLSNFNGESKSEYETPRGDSDHTGLDNPLGYNNCFLNVIVQLLFHIPVFRDFFISIKSHSCTKSSGYGSSIGSCVFCALQILFNHFLFSEHETLTTNQLRESLSKAYENIGRFQLFHMDDACEAYQSLIEQLNMCLTNNGPRIKCFDFDVEEFFLCSVCKFKSNSLRYTTNLLYTVADEILSYKRKRPEISFQSIFRLLTESEERTCSDPNCANRARIYKFTQVPPILCFGFAWNNQSKEEISEFIKLIPEEASIVDFFRNNSIKHCKCRLKGILLYYGLHYQCMIYDEKKELYLLFDDNNVKEIGDFNAVATKCTDGHLLPVLLLYEVIDHPQANKLKSGLSLTVPSSQVDELSSLTSSNDVHLDHFSSRNIAIHQEESRNGEYGNVKGGIGQRRIFRDVEIIQIGTSTGCSGFYLDGNQLSQTITIPPHCTNGQIELCIFNRGKDISGQVGTVYLNFKKSDGSSHMIQHTQRLSESCASILLSFPQSFIDTDHRQIDIVIKFTKL